MNLEEILQAIRPADDQARQRARQRIAELAIPPRALGRLHHLAERLCAITGQDKPRLRERVVLVMAGDHGVAAEGVSAFPQEVTGEMVKNFLAGGASINALAREVGAQVWVVDMGVIPDLTGLEAAPGGRLIIKKVAPGTSNLAQGPAMSREQAQQALLGGFAVASQAIEQGAQLLATGDMGIANTTPSTAIAAAITGRSPAELVGPGTGLDSPGLERKRRVLEQALAVNQVQPQDGLEVLAKLGGFEIGGIAGCLLAAAYHRRPLVIDGLISTAGALVARALCPAVADYIFAGHLSREPAHRIMLEHLGLRPILELEMRLGEGTGAALALAVLGGAARVMSEVLTFAEAGVSQG